MSIILAASRTWTRSAQGMEHNMYNRSNVASESTGNRCLPLVSSGRQRRRPLISTGTRWVAALVSAISQCRSVPIGRMTAPRVLFVKFKRKQSHVGAVMPTDPLGNFQCQITGINSILLKFRPIKTVQPSLTVGSCSSSHDELSRSINYCDFISASK